MNILGISALYHDSAAALCDGGRILAAAQEERFTRRKHDPSIPVNAIRYCLAEGGLGPEVLDAVVYYDNPLLTLDRWLKNCVALGEGCGKVLDRGFDAMFEDKLWVHKRLESAVGGLGRHGKLLVCEHHLSHAASSFFPSPFESAAVITVDGVGEWATTTIGRGQGNRIELLQQINFPHSLGLLYSAFTSFCGFKINSGEYKLMGLAPYGTPRFVDRILDTLIDLKADGSYRLNLDHFEFHRDSVTVGEAFARLFEGPARVPESPITLREMDLAASIQKVTERVMLAMARHARRSTGENDLCLAGGVALNCVANGAILREGIFERVWIQPAAGDAGGALGAALYANHVHFDQPRTVGARDSQRGSYLGPAFAPERIRTFLDQKQAVYEVEADDAARSQRIARHLAEGKIVGHFSGRMEFGPRALGARSILANPMLPDTQAKLNLKIKFRESFRPFAPIVLCERTRDYFDIEGDSPYMLLTAPVRAELRKDFALEDFISPDKGADMLPAVNRVRSTIPAVTHLDYSARLQTVDERDHPGLHRILAAFEALTGCAVLVNTSFNVRGEPIVCTPEDAYLCFMRTDMDILVLENCILAKEDQPRIAEDIDWRSRYELD